jgi:hypothetical protein
VSLLAYAIADAGTDSFAGTGLDGGPLRTLRSDGLAMVVGACHGRGPEPTHANLSAYERILEQLMEQGAILPARFGSRLADDAAARSALMSDAPHLKPALDRIRGAVELGVRAEPPGSEDSRATPDPGRGPGTAPGTAYLQALAERDRLARDVLRRLEPLEAVARSTRLGLGGSPSLPVRAAFLVDRARVGEFATVAARLAEEHTDLAIAVTGPWPPYSFVGGVPA